MNPGPDSLSTTAETLLARAIRADHSLDASILQAVCTDHPQHSARVLELADEWRSWRPVLREIFDNLDGHGTRSDLSERLRARFGVDCDPGISLDSRAPSTGGEPTQDLLNRLRETARSRSRYERVEELDRGGMGAILRVWDQDLRRTLAMKVALGSDSGPKPAEISRFLEEAQITGQLDHPYIVPVHDVGLDPAGELFFTMRLVRGETLADVFEHVREASSDWNEARVLSVLLKVCDAVGYAHDKGVVHRDLKPANIMVGRYGEVYVMDWGLAQVEGPPDRPAAEKTLRVRTHRATEQGDGEIDADRTREGDVLGTPSYMAPEQAHGEISSIGPHTDVYALGALLYHLLAIDEVAMPYMRRGHPRSATAILNAVREGPPTPLRQLVPDAPTELMAIVDRAMARDIGKRYASVREMADELRGYLEAGVIRRWLDRRPVQAGSLLLALGVGLAALLGLSVSELNVVSERELPALWGFVGAMPASVIAAGVAIIAGRRVVRLPTPASRLALVGAGSVILGTALAAVAALVMGRSDYLWTVLLNAAVQLGLIRWSLRTTWISTSALALAIAVPTVALVYATIWTARTYG